MGWIYSPKARILTSIKLPKPTKKTYPMYISQLFPYFCFLKEVIFNMFVLTKDHMTAIGRPGVDKQVTLFPHCSVGQCYLTLFKLSKLRFKNTDTLCN